jgi:hypothetical protein
MPAKRSKASPPNISAKIKLTGSLCGSGQLRILPVNSVPMRLLLVVFSGVGNVRLVSCLGDSLHKRVGAAGCCSLA